MSEGAPSGPIPVRNWPDEAHNRATVNVGDGERLLSAVIGGLLVISGLKRLSLNGLLLTALGGALAYRAASGHCPAYARFGIDTSTKRAGRAVSDVEETSADDSGSDYQGA
ncbi:MAG: YgaP family membrane protein [Gammaproteobacteria bacterium]